MKGKKSVENELKVPMIWQVFKVNGHLKRDLTDINQELDFVYHQFLFNEGHKQLKIINYPRMETPIINQMGEDVNPHEVNLTFLYWGETALDWLPETASFFERVGLQVIQSSTKTYRMDDPQHQEQIASCFQSFLAQLLSEDESDDAPSRFPLASGDFKTKFARYFDFFNAFQLEVDYFSPQSSTDFGEEYVKLIEPVTKTAYSFYRSHGVTHFDGAYPWSQAYPISNHGFEMARKNKVQTYLEAIKALEGVQSWETLLPESVFNDSSLV